MTSEIAVVNPEDFEWPTEVHERLATLTDKQRSFVLEYLIDFNATKATRRAGYQVADDNSAAQIGWRLLRHAKVGPIVADLAQLSAEQLGLSRAYILTRLRDVAEKAIKGGPKYVGKDGNIARDEDGNVVYEWSPQGAAKALELIARLRGDMIERKQVDVRSVNVTINDVTMEDIR